MSTFSKDSCGKISTFSSDDLCSILTTNVGEEEGCWENWNGLKSKKKVFNSILTFRIFLRVGNIDTSDLGCILGSN